MTIKPTTKIWCCGQVYEGDDSTICTVCGFKPPTIEEAMAMIEEEYLYKTGHYDSDKEEGKKEEEHD